MTPTIDDIKQQVCRAFDVGMWDLKSGLEPKRLMFPRHAAFYLCARYTSKSFKEIAKAFKTVDINVMYGVRNIEDAIKEMNPAIMTKLKFMALRFEDATPGR